MKRYFTIVRILGVLVFCGVFILIILFAQGYKYDTKEMDIIKEGVIYFESVGIFAPDSVKPVFSFFVDGKLQGKVPSPGELRLAPGPHDIEINSDGYFPWKKYVVVPDDEVVRFSPIRLFPKTGMESEYFTALFRYNPSHPRGVYFEEDQLYYVNGSALYRYDLKEKSVRSFRIITTPIIWLSRIPGTFHFLFITSKNDLLYCDEDFENCHSMGNIEIPFS